MSVNQNFNIFEKIYDILVIFLWKFSMILTNFFATRIDPAGRNETDPNRSETLILHHHRMIKIIFSGHF